MFPKARLTSAIFSAISESFSLFPKTAGIFMAVSA
jgi:hypothetical protein